MNGKERTSARYGRNEKKDKTRARWRDKARDGETRDKGKRKKECRASVGRAERLGKKGATHLPRAENKSPPSFALPGSFVFHFDLGLSHTRAVVLFFALLPVLHCPHAFSSSFSRFHQSIPSPVKTSVAGDHHHLQYRAASTRLCQLQVRSSRVITLYIQSVFLLSEHKTERSMLRRLPGPLSALMTWSESCSILSWSVEQTTT